MKYILIDLFNETINIVCKDDESGDYLILDTLAEAKIAKEEYCQNGIIVPLGDFMTVLEDCSGFIGAALFELGEEEDEDGNTVDEEDSLEASVNQFLQ